MSKQIKGSRQDHAPFLELGPGLHNLRYSQKFVRAPASLHPKREDLAKEKREAAEACSHAMSMTCHAKG